MLLDPIRNPPASAARRFKKLRDLKVGDALQEGAGRYLAPAGRLAAVLEDPQHPGRLWLLAAQPDKRLTIYAGDAEGPYIHLARGLPANIFWEWCALVNNGITFPELPPKQGLPIPVVVDNAVPADEVHLVGPGGELKGKPVNLQTEEVEPTQAVPLCLVDFP